MEEKEKIKKILKKSGNDYEQLSRTMPDLVKLIKTVDGGADEYLIYANAIPKKQIGILISEKTHLYGQSKMDKYTSLKVYRNREIYEEDFFAYNGSSYSHNFNNYFEKAKILKIEDDSLEIRLTARNGSETTKNIQIKGKKTQKYELEQLITKIEREKERLLKEHTRPGTMPYWVLENRMSFTRQGRIISEESVPYLKPRVLSENINYAKEEAILTIKAQIDNDCRNGIQFEHCTYKITKDGSKLIDRKTVWDRLKRE